jgi:hypothetical protein
MSSLDQRIAASAHFSDLTEVTALAAAKPMLAQAREVFGFVPNLAVVMAAEPAALESYFHSLKAFGETTLTPEQQTVCAELRHQGRVDCQRIISSIDPADR